MKHITQTTHRWIGINGTALSKELKQPLNNGVGNRAGHIVHQSIESKGVVQGSIYIEISQESIGIRVKPGKVSELPSVPSGWN